MNRVTFHNLSSIGSVQLIHDRLYNRLNYIAHFFQAILYNIVLYYLVGLQAHIYIIGTVFCRLLT